jgi:multiple sugar transport system permease protein
MAPEAQSASVTSESIPGTQHPKRGLGQRWFGVAGSIRRGQVKFLFWAFSPVIALFIIIRVIPILWLLSLSVTNFSLKRLNWKVVGLRNFQRMLQDTQFVLAFKNTMEFVALSVPAVIILGLLFAVLINRKLRLEGLYQTLYFLPFILSTVPSSIIWKWIYAPGKFGLANYVLEAVGLNRVRWLTDPKIAMLSIIAMYVWKNLGYYVVVFLVGLKNIPFELREAAEVDGASPVQATWHIDLPLLRPLVLFGTVYATISAMAVFTIVYVMSQGTDVSTGTELTVLAVRVYQEGFTYGNMGYASAISGVLFLVALLAVIVQFRLLGRE